MRGQVLDSGRVKGALRGTLLAVASTLLATSAAAQGAAADSVGSIGPVSVLRRCGAPRQADVPWSIFATPTDCDSSHTVPSAEYSEGGLREFKLVFHVIEAQDGRGRISDELIRSQVVVLNQDFRALVNTPGGDGNDVQFGFALADVDPDGNPTSGITRHQNDGWFSDSGSYWVSLAWDPTRYINVYTNNADGFLGYAYPPADPTSEPGALDDRVVIHWQSIGFNSPNNQGYDQGRTLTHELGHYFGLDHTFAPNPTEPETYQCPADEEPDCYSSGDLICDTPSEDAPAEACVNKTSCGSLDPVENYMNYSPDACLTQFTSEQALRMRCTVLNYRPSVLWPSATLSAASSSVDVFAGETAVHQVSLQNSGSTTASFSAALSPSGGAFPSSFETGERWTSPALEPGQSLTLEVQTSVPSSAQPGAASDVELVVTTADNGVAANLTLTTNVKQPGQVALSPVASQSAPPGGTTEYLISVRNNGLQTDTISLQLTPAGAVFEQTGAPDLTLNLEAMSQQELLVLVTLPPDAQIGESLAHTVSARSRLSPSSQASVDLETLIVAVTTKASLSPALLQSTAQPGQVLRQQLTLLNLGNHPEEFALDLADLRGDAEVTLQPETVGPLAASGTPGDSAEIELTVAIGKQASALQPLSVLLEARADGQSSPVATTRWEISVSEVRGLRWLVEDPTLSARPGESVRFSVELLNDGNGEGRFQLSLASDALIAKRDLPANVELAGFESNPFSVELQVPDDATPSSLLSAWLLAQARSDPSWKARLELSVRVARPEPQPTPPQDAGRPTPDAGTPVTPEFADADSPKDADGSPESTRQPVLRTRVRGDGCGCRLPSAPVAPGWWMLGAMLAAWERRRASRASPRAQLRSPHSKK